MPSLVALTGALGLGPLRSISTGRVTSSYQPQPERCTDNDVAANDLATTQQAWFLRRCNALYQQVLARQPTTWAATYDWVATTLQGKYEAALSRIMIRVVEMRPAEPKQYLTLA